MLGNDFPVPCMLFTTLPSSSLPSPPPLPVVCTAVQPLDHESYYTAWSSVSGLVKKGLVQKQGNPAKLVKERVCVCVRAYECAYMCACMICVCVYVCMHVCA